MQWLILPHVYIFVIAACTALGMAIAAWRWRSMFIGANWFVLMSISLGWWSLAAGLEAATVYAGHKILFSKLEYLGMLPALTLSIVFVSKNTRQDSWFKFPYTILLWVVPVLSFVLICTNEAHGLFWTGFSSLPETNSIIYHHGPVFWLVMAYVYGLSLALTLLLIRALIHFHRIYRRQMTLFVAGIVFSLSLSVIYVSGVIDLRGVDISPMGPLVMNTCIFIAIWRYGLFRLVPVARHVVIETLVDGVLVLNTENYVVDVNPTASRLLGLNVDKILGRSLSDILESQPTLIQYLIDTPSGQIETRIESDPLCFITVQISPFYDRQDMLSGRTVVLRDDTQRHQMEEALRQSETRLRHLTDNMLDVITETDGQSIIKYITSSVQNMIGYSAEELLGRSFNDFFIPEVREYMIKAIRHSYEEVKAGARPVYVFQYPTRHADGRLLWIEAFSHMVFDESGKFTTAITTHRDITDRRMAQQALQESERKYRRLIENMNDVVWEMTPDIKFTYISPTVYEQQGYIPEEVIGRSLEEFLDSNKTNEILKLIKQRSIETKNGRRLNDIVFTFEQRRKDGSTFWCEAVSKPLYDDEGKLVGFQGVSRDISERVKAEEILRKTMAEVEAFNKAMVGRELRMVELKEEINNLLAQMGKPPKYEVPS